MKTKKLLTLIVFSIFAIQINAQDVTHDFQGHRNVNSVATNIPTITLSTTNAITLLPANPNRLYVSVSNCDTVKSAWIRLQPASDGNDAIGILLLKQERFELCGPTMYTGEISGVADSGTPGVCVVAF